MTVGELVASAEGQLASKGVPEAAANAEFLMAHLLECKRPAVRLQSSRALSANQERHYRQLVLERGRRVPLAYVLGSQDFMGLDIRVTPAVLIPRPETEELVEAAVEAAKRVPRRAGSLQVLDIGTGSGCVSIALAHLLPEAQIVATDISAPALALAQDNARAHQLGQRIRFVQADLFHPAGKRTTAAWADVAVSNPPYIPSGELPGLEPEVLKEPRLALDGGPDGLAAIRAIIDEVPPDLRPGGWLALEIGHGQHEAVRGLLAAKGFHSIEVRRDAQGELRIALAKRPG
ncbi:MAG: peptide chain release factor N(5)-glutamine methyltransferase [Elusimicrobia bacterium]|nr:peptide chain release factor N(5)-glutamine methyltransferase [Elusimicrobiota bacterium]